MSSFSYEGDVGPPVELDRGLRAPLLAYFKRKVQNHAEAEDLTQEVLMRLSSQSQPPQALQAYAFVTAANLLRDRARVRITHLAAAHDCLDETHSSTNADPRLVENRTPERILAGKDALREFVLALETLNERTRDIFILARIERVSRRDIAQLFGISVSAVEKHLTKALVDLGARLSAR